MASKTLVFSALFASAFLTRTASAIPTLSATDRDPSVVLSSDRLGASFTNNAPRAVRSSSGIAPRSGVYYFEARRLIPAGVMGFGVASSSESLQTNAGASNQSAGVTLHNNAIYYNNTWSGSLPGQHDTYGFVVDYRGARPIVHIITSNTLTGGGNVAGRFRLNEVSGPVYAFVYGTFRYGIAGDHQAINTTGPWRFDARAVLNAAFYRGGEIGILPWFDPDANAAPSITFSSAPRAAALGAAVTFSASAPDREDGPRELAWSASNGASGSGSSFVFSAASPGRYTITASAIDAAGLAGTRSVTIEVLADPSGDRDGDGHSNLAEASAGTNRQNPRDWPGRGRVYLDQRHDSVILDADRLGATFPDSVMRAARSDVTIQPGSGWYYFEGRRGAAALSNAGFGVASAAASLDAAGGADAQSYGLFASGEARYNGAVAGTFPDPSSVETYGIAVDYSGQNPVVHAMVSCVPVPEYGGPFHMDGRSCTYDVAGHAGLPMLALPAVTLSGISGPLHIFAFGQNGANLRINGGHDLRAAPFVYPANYFLFGEGRTGAEFLGDGWGPEHTYGGRPIPEELDRVQLVTDDTTNWGVTLTPDSLGVNYTVYSKSLVRANQAMIGEFRYFESTRTVPWSVLQNTPAIGQGVITAHGQADPYPFQPPQPSLAVNSYSGIWRNLVWTAPYDAPNNDTYGFAVDYRGARPIVYTIIGGQVVHAVTLTDVFLPLYPMVYGHNSGGNTNVVTTVNFGATPFRYDAQAALQAAGVNTSAFVPGWGYTNRPAALRDDDGDGLNEAAETAAGTDPSDGDTDNDGLNDGAETASDPLRADTDRDGIPDGREVSWSLSPNNASDAALDHDGDGATTLAEFLGGTDPRSAGSTPPVVPPAVLSSTDKHSSVSLSANFLGVTYTAWGTRAARSTVGIMPRSGFFYYEGHREIAAANYGFGVASAGAPLDNFGGSGTDSVGMNALGSIFFNSGWVANFPRETEYYGFAVDYRGDSPIVYMLASSGPGTPAAVRRVQTLSAVTTPLYIFVYGLRETAAVQQTINAGATPFAFDARAVLAAAGVSGASEVRLGWYQPAPRIVNQAPIVSVAGGDRTITLGSPVTITAAASDDSGELSALIRWRDRDGTATGLGASFTFTPQNAGPHRVTASAIDADGMLDTVSVIVTVDANADADGDGLTTPEETALGTSTTNPDTDGDGLNDGAERTLGTNATNADTDGDGTSDGWEVANNLDPRAADSTADLDGDRYTTLAEFRAGSDPRNSASTPVSIVRLSATDRHPSIVLSADQRGLGFTTQDQRGVRSNVAVRPGSGFYYFEAQRQIGAGNFGAGVATAAGLLGAYGGASAESAGFSFNGQIYYNGGWYANFSAADSFGFAVDYRGANPIVHFISGGNYVRSVTLSQVDDPLYVLAFGGWVSPGGTQLTINAGAANFRYDPRPILSAAGVDPTNLYLGFASELPDAGPPDTDGDGLDDVEESLLGTDPNNPDTDGDGLDDGAEVNEHNTDPLDGSTILYARLATNDAHPTVRIDGERLSAGFGAGDHRAVRSDRAIAPGSGFYYYEGRRLIAAGNFGFGFATAQAPLDNFGGATNQSVGLNCLGQVYSNGGWFGNFDNSGDTYGLAVDYRGATPIVYLIANGAFIRRVDLTAISAPLHIFVYGTAQTAGLQQAINTGDSAFTYDPRAILSAAGIDATALALGFF